jgi:hypothetical protein
VSDTEASIREQFQEKIEREKMLTEIALVVVEGAAKQDDTPEATSKGLTASAELLRKVTSNLFDLLTALGERLPDGPPDAARWKPPEPDTSARALLDEEKGS